VSVKKRNETRNARPAHTNIGGKPNKQIREERQKEKRRKYGIEGWENGKERQ
jgi:hypothetical protein